MGIFTVTDPDLTFKLALIYFPLILILFSLGLVVYLNDKKVMANRWFFATLCSFSLWSLIRFVSDLNELQAGILADKFTLSFSVLMAVCYFYFSIHYISYSKLPRILHVILITPALLTFIFGPTTYWYITGFQYLNSDSKSVSLEVTPLYTANTIYIGMLCLTGLFLIYRKSRSSVQDKKQAQYVYLGLAAALVVNIANDFFFVSGGRDIVGLIPPATSAMGFLIFGSLVSYAMLRENLFDIKEFALRLLGYSTSIIVLAIMYGLILYLFSSTLLPYELTKLSVVLGILISALTAITFPAIKKFFDKLSRRLFFRNAYDSSVVLGKLNDVFIAEPNLEPMLSNSLSIIGDNLVPAYAELFAVDQYKSFGSATIGYKRPNKKHALDRLLNTPWPESNLLVINDPTITSPAKFYLESLNADLMLRLSTKDMIVGYLLLGPKRNGDKYTEQDVSLLKIIAKNLGLAIQGAMQYTKIQNFNTTLKEEVAAATKDLRSTNQKLNKLSKAKDEMISMVSHQLIPQLTATHGFIELMEKSSTDKEELIKLSRSSTARMTRLAQDMLNSTKIQAGELKLELEEADLVPLIQGEIDNLAYAAKKHMVKVHFNHPDRYLTRLDIIKFQEAIFNVIDNAIQYSPPKSEVFLSLKKNYLSILDHGIGIPESEQLKLFDKFFRASNAITHRPSGSGIGLFVSFKIIKAHNFDMTISSSEDKGTEVKIRLEA